MGRGLDGSVRDTIRKISVSDGPEERVRQAFLLFLIEKHGVPAGLIAVESAVKGASRSYRSDILVYDRSGAPWMLIECKAPRIGLNQSGFDQLGTYNRHIKAPFMVITNGTEHYCCAVDSKTGTLSFLETLPEFPPGP